MGWFLGPARSWGTQIRHKEAKVGSIALSANGSDWCALIKVSLLVILLLATISLGQTKDEDDTTNNEVLSSPSAKPPINLDANLRRALLKALTELENEEKAKQEQGHNTAPIINLPHIDISDKVVEKASASALSFIANTESARTTSTTTTTEKPFVIIQKSTSVQSKPITSIEHQRHKLDPINDAEQILTSASNSFSPNKYTFSKNENPRSVISNGASSNSLLNDIKEITKSSRQKIEVTSPSTTTTSTEESQAKVEDVQFFSAPLVAAFTVHQDETGLPKSVEPIFKPKINKVEQPKAALDTSRRTQLALHDKQKQLEDEILRLRQQQQRQNYYIRQQQLLHEQQLQLHKQKILEEQIRLRNNQQPFVPIVNTANSLNQNKINSANNNNTPIKGTLVSFQPSITLTAQQQQLLQNGQLPQNAQHLPVRNAGEFRTPFQYQPFNTFQPINQNQQQQQLPQLNHVQNFNSIPQPELTLTVPKHNRHFRQETGTGNFFNNNNNNNNNFQSGFNSGFNYNFNQFPLQQQQHQPQSNRFFRSSAESTFTSPPFNNFQRVQPPVVNHHLNNLLYNSGIIRGRQQEDLNIVSKVLSLNHLGGDYRFSGGATHHIQPQIVPAPSLFHSKNI